MEPYHYSINWYPTQEQKENGEVPKVLQHGVFITDSQFSAYVKMIDMVEPDKALEAEQIEFMAKPFLDSSSCNTKKDIGDTLMYNFYVGNIHYELRSSTANLDDFMKGTFLNYVNDYKKPELPKAMMMIDVMALINDDKKL